MKEHVVLMQDDCGGTKLDTLTLAIDRDHDAQRMRSAALNGRRRNQRTAVVSASNFSRSTREDASKRLVIVLEVVHKPAAVSAADQMHLGDFRLAFIGR